MPTVDVVVVGLGAMGSAALCSLARRGHRVVGIERFSPGHDLGSSHGETRIIRLGYFEHPSYVPLVQAALALWREREAQCGSTLLHVTGVLEIGAPDCTLIKGTLASSIEHMLSHEVLASGPLMRRFPAFRVPADFVGVLQPDGGFLLAEAGVHAQLALAKAGGAEIRTEQTVRGIEPRPGGVHIDIASGAIDAGAVIIAAGAWAKSLLPDLPLRITRQVLAWFAPREPALFARERFPVFLLETPHGVYYGFPPLRDGHVAPHSLKIAKHHHREQIVDPDRYDRTLSAADEAVIRSAIADYLPAADGKLLAAKTCLYTMTSDGDFILDHMPGHPQIVVASPCSGHGFKFAPVIGEILADLATRGDTPYDISRFRMRRFAALS
jgi:sarcosine oxidase